MKPLTLIVAIADGGVIGKGGTLPWRISEDLKHFKESTLGHAIIMGRKTHESIGRALPGRRNIVVTRDAGRSFEGCETAASVEAAIELARKTDDHPHVIGGEAIYNAALPSATRILLTEVHRQVEGGGDAFFHLDRTGWRETARRLLAEGAELVTLER